MHFTRYQWLYFPYSSPFTDSSRSNHLTRKFRTYTTVPLGFKSALLETMVERIPVTFNCMENWGCIQAPICRVGHCVFLKKKIYRHCNGLWNWVTLSWTYGKICDLAPERRTSEKTHSEIINFVFIIITLWFLHFIGLPNSLLL